MKRKREDDTWISRGFKRLFPSGLTYPGHNYMGPGNPLDNGPPTNENDLTSLIHDRRYKYLQDEGKDVYTAFSDADQQWLNDIHPTDSIGAALGYAWFNGKKALWKAGLIPKHSSNVHGPTPSAGKSPILSPRNENNKRSTNPRIREFKRQKLFAEETKQQSLTNLQENAQPVAMNEGSNIGSGNNAGLKETPIDDVGIVTRGPPEYTFASLPYIRDSKASGSYFANDIGFRMTSPLDPSIIGAASTDLNAGAGTATFRGLEALDSADTTQVSARWFDFYSTLYNYYHVISAKWHMTIENLNQEPIWCHYMYCNDEYPPGGATNEDIQCWPDARSHMIGSHAVAVTSSGTIEANQSNSNVNNVEGATEAGQNPNYETASNQCRLW